MFNKKILIVEDEECLLKLEGILLRAKGFAVQEVANGQAALDAISEDLPDLVLLDVALPEVGGFDVCYRIKNNPPTKDIPVVLLTAKKTREDMARGKQVGADYYITKPFKSAHMIETINRLLYRELA